MNHIDIRLAWSAGAFWAAKRPQGSQRYLDSGVAKAIREFRSLSALFQPVVSKASYDQLSNIG